MITTNISREKLYRKEYRRDTLLRKEGMTQEGIITESLGIIITMMLHGKGEI